MPVTATPDASARHERLAAARLYFVCDAGFDPIALEGLLGQALAGGADIVQLRDKHAPDRALRAAASLFRDAAAERGALFILNDRPELAAELGADGVHVGQDDMGVAEAREAVGPDAIVGLSSHAPAQLDAAIAATGAALPDYVSIGPVWETPTKAGRPAAGLDYVRYAADRLPPDGEESLPWFAIGGIDSSNVADVAAAGARRIVVVRAIRDADEPADAARELRAAVAGTGAEVAR
jgi:thiamine-phosphate pyrophosphorylase